MIMKNIITSFVSSYPFFFLLPKHNVQDLVPLNIHSMLLNFTACNPSLMIKISNESKEQHRNTFPEMHELMQYDT